MQMCAGVQNVSRPMVSCHEMSHTMPTRMHIAANTTAAQGQGARALTCRARVAAGASAGVKTGLILVVSIQENLGRTRARRKTKLPCIHLPICEFGPQTKAIQEAPTA